MRCLVLGAALVLLAAFSGCGPGRARVHGVIRYQGKPLKGGTIIFLAADNQAYPAPIAQDGSYQIAAVPCGPVRVAIQPAASRVPPRPQSDGKDDDAFARKAMAADDAAKRASKRPAAGPGEALPAQYADAGKSGLSFELRSADHDYSPDLK
jgi:hypothetical protein